MNAKSYEKVYNKQAYEWVGTIFSTLEVNGVSEDVIQSVASMLGSVISAARMSGRMSQVIGE